LALTSRANWVKGTKSGVAVKCLVDMMEFVDSSRNGRTVDTQWPSFSAQGTSVGTLEVLKHSVSVGDEIGRHLDVVSDGTIQTGMIHTGGDFSKRVIFH
jgi:hypothetical protein